MTTAENCILYTRSSKDGHDIAPATQRKELQAYAKQKGYRIVGDYSDAAVSANASPPQLAAMLRELKNKARGWSIIVAVDSSRLARDTDLAGVISYQVRKAGVRVEFSKMQGSGNAAMDTLVGGVMRAIDAFHSLVSKEKGLAGMKHNVEQGHRAGGRAPLGYELLHTPTGAERNGVKVEKSRLVLNPETAPKVKAYLQARVAGLGRPGAMRKSGLERTPFTTLIGVERNALVYAGITVWNRHAENGPHRYRPREQWVLKRGTHEALIGEPEAEALMQRAMPTTRTRSPSGRFLLSGFLFTPEGKPLFASGDGCYREGKGQRISAARLEAVVRDRMNEDVDSHEFTQRYIAELRRAADGISTDPQALAADRRKVERRIANLLALAERSPDSPTLAERLRELEAQRAEIEARSTQSIERAALQRALRGTTPAEARKMLAAWIEQDAQTVDEQRAAMGQLVERVEFDLGTGQGRVHYRIPLQNGGRFDFAQAASELGLGWRGLLASRRGFEPRLPP